MMISQTQTTAVPSQTAVPLLTGKQCYQAIVATYGITPPSEEERRGYAVQAKEGNQDARQAVILTMYHLVASIAHKYASGYAWTGRIDYEDVAQVGMLTVVERLDAALEADEPYGYLTVAARTQMARYCHHNASPIRTPRRGSVKEAHRPFQRVERLEAVIDQETGLTLAETLQAPSETAVAHRDATPLYAALQALPERHREVIVRHYGLFDQGPEPFISIERERGFRAKAYHTAALHQLATTVQGMTR